MEKITVYKFTIFNPKNNIDELARGMATKETISNIKGSKIIEESAEIIDRSKLTQSKRYHPVYEK